MDLSQLPALGKVAGVPGIALGAFVLVAGAALALTEVLPEAWRGPVLVLPIAVAGLLGGLGLLGWMRGQRGGAQVARTEGDRSEARNEDASKSGGRQEARTRGKDSPAVNIRR